MTGCIGIALGDASGIGPEVTLKALAAQAAAEAEAKTDPARYLLIGDAAQLQRLNAELHLNLPLESWNGNSPRQSTGRFLIHNSLPEPLPAKLPPGSPVAARAAVAWLKTGAELCLGQELDALVTAPVNKETIIQTGLKFTGQTEFLSEMAGAKRTAMMLLGHDDRGRWLRVALATTHLPLRQVADHLTQTKIELVIELAARACADLGLPQSRIAVCGLNPHAGEGGAMGTEEITIIAPAVAAARRKNIEVSGPFAADALFYHVLKGEYEMVVAMYHDQGLAPLKMIAFESGINWTLGLPFIRTSPDHGTAYDIAGRGIAHPGSMRAALRLARQLSGKNLSEAGGKNMLRHWFFRPFDKW